MLVTVSRTIKMILKVQTIARGMPRKSLPRSGFRDNKRKRATRSGGKNENIEIQSLGANIGGSYCLIGRRFGLIVAS